MEFVQSLWRFISIDVWPYWPGMMFILVMSIVAQTLKSQVLTKTLAQKFRLIFWLRRLFPLAILFLGSSVGLIWPGEPSPGVITTIEKILYFMGCTGVSMIGYNIVRTYIKKKYDLDISVSLPSEDSIPPGKSE